MLLKPVLYKYKTDKSLLQKYDFAAEGCGIDLLLQTEKSRWRCTIFKMQTEPGCFEYNITFIVEDGTETGAVGCEMVFDNWHRDNYVFMPAAVYNGNRFRSLPLKYPPLLTEPQDQSVDVPLTVTDIPRLNIEQGPSRIEQTSGDLATPAMGFYDPNNKKAILILAKQGNDFGNYGFFIEENSERKNAVFTICSPCVRSRRYEICGFTDSPDIPANFKKGDRINIRFRIYDFEADTLQCLFEKFCDIRKGFCGDSQLANELSFSEAFNIISRKFNSFNWSEENNYYAVGDKTTINQHWQLGWVGGGMITQAFLSDGDELSRQRSIRNLNMIFEKTQSESGFFYTLGNAKEWYYDGFFGPHPRNMMLIRKNADALYFLIKQFDLIEKQGGNIPPLWKNGAKKLADAIVRVWQKYGQFGQFIDGDSGDIVVGNTTAGAIVPAALGACYKYYNEKAYLKTALESAQYYYERDVTKGLTTGGPSEILHAPDSESAFGMLESFVVLFEITGDKKWLGYACEMAKQCATWCASYNFKFPAGTTFDRLKMHTVGAVFASAQNKCGCPAICTLSGDSLLKLFRATNDIFYLDLLRDIAHGIPQYISRTDRKICDLDPGWISERVPMGDWEGPEMVGEVPRQSCWPETSCMLTYAEVPGLYVQPDKGFVFAIDHINCRVVEKNENSLAIELHNPCGFEAKVKIFSEQSSECSKMLGFNFLAGKSIVSLAPGERKIITENCSR